MGSSNHPVPRASSLWLLRHLRPRPAVAQPDRAVEDEPPRRRIRIAAEIAEALELHRGFAVVAGKRWFEQRAGYHFQGSRVEVGHHVALGAGMGAAEQRVVEADLSRHSLC